MGILSTIAQGIYTPKVIATHVDANGNYTDDKGNPTTLYSQPGFFQRAFNPEAREIYQINLQAGASPIQSERQRAVQRHLIGQDISTIPDGQLPFGNNTQANISGTINPALSPSHLIQQVHDEGALATGAIPAIGAQEARNNLYSTSKVDPYRLANENYYQTNVAPLQFGLAAQQAQGGLNDIPYINDANLSDAIRQKMIASRKLLDAPLDIGSLHNQAVINNIASSRGPEFPLFTPRLNGDRLMAPTKDPLAVNPMAALMGRIEGLNGANNVATLSSGRSYPLPPASQYSESPNTVGTQQLPPEVPPKLMSLKDYPDFALDPTTRRLFYQGQDVTGDSRFDAVRRAGLHEAATSHEDINDAHHDAAQAALKAQSAILGAKIKALKAEHQSSGVLPLLAKNFWENFKQGAVPTVGLSPYGLPTFGTEQIGNVPGLIANKYHRAYNTLIGQ